jgi:citrate lyase beta subunit
VGDLGHFSYLSDAERSTLFQVPPTPFSRDADRAVLADALGATLYSPATRPDLVTDLSRAREHGLVSSVICLEDSIRDDEVAAALDHVVAQLGLLHARVDEAPLVFVRVRAPEQVSQIVDRLGARTAALAGFVIPKFGAEIGREALDRVRKAAASAGRRLWAMPVIETAEVAHRETRTQALLAVDQLLSENADITLAVRIGATDLAALYGLRRPKELTVYDVRVVADAIADIVNVLGRVGTHDRVITGAVWEYFAGSERIFKPQLRETPFGVEERALRAGLIAAEVDGLIREVVLDRANGVVGKTVIHPTHVPVVHALSVVSSEDHADALAVLDHGSSGGVVRSAYRNKMNESRPHRAWAERTLRRAAAFGVARDGITFADLLAAVLRA